MKRHKLLGKRLFSVGLVSIILAVTVFAGLSTSLMVSASNPPTDIGWEKTYGGSSYKYARSVEQTADGRYIMGGGNIIVHIN